ncbi:translation initiation factor IF-1 [Patescibacteria group bacterium]
MSKEDIIEVQGVVTEPLPNAEFKVEIQDENYKDMIITARLSGKMRMNYIKILPGDLVTIELSIYDLTKGRITYRHKN